MSDFDDGFSRLSAVAATSWLYAIIESSDDAIISKSLDGVIQTWNPAAERMFGYSAAEAIGCPITMLVPPDRGDEEPQILAKLRAGERIDHFKTVRVRKDGSRFDISVSISPVRDNAGQVVGASKVARDLSSQKNQLVVEAKLAGIVRAALDCIVGMDSLGNVTEWNPAAVATFGYSREEAIGSAMADLIIPLQFRDRHRSGLARYLATGEGPVLNKRLELTAVRKSGEEFPVELTITPIAFAEPPIFTGFIRDITEHKRIEAGREQLLQSERDARADAERISRIKDEFLATLSHELRTPLNAILGWAQLLRGSDDPAEMENGLEVIERNARSQSQIIEDLLDMSRIISGKLRLDLQRLDLAAVVHAAVNTAKPAAEAKGIRLTSVVDPLHRLAVSGDANRLQQILWNLLSNAIKFTQKGGQVRVLLERVNSHVEITVIDTGDGIDPEFLPYVFDRFRQSDSSITRRHGGLGLGLSIVKQLVELHGGSVRVKSPGRSQGSTFTVALPVVVAHPESEADEERRHPRATPIGQDPPAICGEIKGLSVLVVDDEPDARTLVKKILEGCGAAVVAVSSAQEAFKLLQSERFDVLVSDIGMPHEDGMSLIRRVRQLGPHNGGSIPAIALTAYARTEDRIRAVAAGFMMHVAKPVEALELITMVAGAAGRTGRAEAP